VSRGHEGFERFVAVRGGALFAYASVLTGGRPQQAEDLLQEALLRILKHWSRLAEGTEETYVRRTLQRLATDDHRRRRRRPEVVVDLRDDLNTAVAGADETLAERHDLVAALARLPARQRVVVVLRYWEDRSEREVADLLRIPVGTVKSEASRGLARLRDALAAWETQ
jgi:RNA polymerase sigma-70 factor (sigma-E family)